MPTLARQIINENADKSNKQPEINFKGFMVGNPYTDPVENAKGCYDTWYGHQLVSKPTYENWYTTCRDGAAPESNTCDGLMSDMQTEVGNLNPYALDFDVCLSSNGENAKKAGRHERHTLLAALLPDAVKERLRDVGGYDLTQEYEPCSDNFCADYLNTNDVKKAIHANTAIKWNECSSTLNYNMSDLNIPMEPVYQEIIASGADIKILIYSGDDDSVCGTLGTQSWIYDIGQNVTDSWKPWLDSEGQVGGYLTKFEGFSFVTIHGAGHMVPATQPLRSLDVVKAFLKGELTNN